MCDILNTFLKMLLFLYHHSKCGTYLIKYLHKIFYSSNLTVLPLFAEEDRRILAWCDGLKLKIIPSVSSNFSLKMNNAFNMAHRYPQNLTLLMSPFSSPTTPSQRFLWSILGFEFLEHFTILSLGRYICCSLFLAQSSPDKFFRALL